MAKNPLLGVRVPPELLARLDALVSSLPGTTRPALVKAALEIGLTALEKDPRVGGAKAKRK